MQDIVVHSLAELEVLASRLLGTVAPDRHARVFALTGNLGSGKTAFAQAFAKVLGIAERITSPTFVIMKRYAIPRADHFQNLVHIDAYRTESAVEFSAIKIEEVLANPHTIAVIEWADRIPRLIPDDALWLHFETIDKTTRKIRYGKKDITRV